MAFQHIRIKNTNVAGKVPGADKLDIAELCVNLKDHKLYSKDADGNIFELGKGGDAQVPGGDTPPGTGNEIGDLFFDTINNVLLYWDGSQWVPVVDNTELELNDLKDVTVDGATDGQVLAYDANSGEWVAVDTASLSVDVDLAYTPAADKGTVTNNAGDDAELPLVDETNAGLMSPEDYKKLGEMPDFNTGDNQPGNPSIGDIWVDTSQCPPVINIWDDCDDPGNPTWKPIGGDGGDGGGCVQGTVSIVSSNGTELGSTLTAVGGNGADAGNALSATYEWTGVKTGSGNSIVADVEGEYTVTATVTCADGSKLTEIAQWVIVDTYSDMVNKSQPIIDDGDAYANFTWAGNQCFVTKDAQVTGGENPVIVETNWFIKPESGDYSLVATNDTYTIKPSDPIGGRIICNQTFRDDRGNEIISNQSNQLEITAVPSDVITFTPIITDDGTAEGNLVGHTLTAAALDIQGGTAPAEYAFKWYRGDVEIGAADKTYTLVADDVGLTIKCEITVAEPDGSGAITQVAYYGRPIVDHPEMVNKNAPFIAVLGFDAPHTGSTLYVVTNATVEGGINPQVDKTEWYLEEANGDLSPRGQGISYVIQDIDTVGLNLVCTQTFKDDRGDEITSETSNRITVVKDPALEINFRGVILDDGTPEGNQVGHVLTAVAQDITGGTAPIEYEYRWVRAGLVIGGSSKTYLLSEFDVGYTIRCDITVAEPDGSDPYTKTVYYDRTIVDGAPAVEIAKPEVLSPADGAGIGGDVSYYPETSAITTVDGPTDPSLPDGWNSITSVTTGGWKDVTYGDGKLVAVSSSGDDRKRIMYNSGDPANSWTLVDTPESKYIGYKVIYDGTKFVATSLDQTQKSMHSTNGTSWSSGNTVMDVGSIDGFAYGNGVYLTLGGQSEYQYKSTDGITWTKDSQLPSPGSSIYWRDLAFGNGRFVGVATYTDVDKTIISCTDGTDWEFQTGTLPAGMGYRGVAYGNNKWIVVGEDEKGLTSPDGLNWTPISIPKISSYFAFKFLNGKFIICSRAVSGVADSVDTVYTSVDGITWLSEDMPVLAENGIGYSPDQNKYVAVGSRCAMWSYTAGPSPTTLTLTNDKAFDSADGTEMSTIDQVFKAGDKVVGEGDATVFANSLAFSTTTYDGSGSSRDVTTGIDNSNKSLVWIKNRKESANNYLVDTERGNVNGSPDLAQLSSNTNYAEASSYDGVTELVKGGFNISGGKNTTNQSGNQYVAWNFRAAPGFLDIVTYEGNDVAGRQIPHSLNSVPGVIITKQTNSAFDWGVYHKELGTNQLLRLNSSEAAITPATAFGEPTDKSITVNNNAFTNQSNKNYVAYLFADTPGLIKCGSYDGNSSTQSIDVGFKPDWVLIKAYSGAKGHWTIFDRKRDNRALSPNLSNAQVDYSGLFEFTDTGFKVSGANPDVNAHKYIYVAIAENASAGQFFPTGVLTEDADKDSKSMTLTDVTGEWMPGFTAVNETEVTEHAPCGGDIQFLSSKPETVTGTVNSWGTAKWTLNKDLGGGNQETQTATVQLQNTDPEQGPTTFNVEDDTQYTVYVEYSSADPASGPVMSDPNNFQTCTKGVDDWAGIEAPGDSWWKSITYGEPNGKPTFVAVAHNGIKRVMYSHDAINWQLAQQSQDNVWNAVTYGNNMFVAVSQNGTNRAMYSPDGINWTASAGLPQQLMFTAVAWGGDKFVAVATTAPGGISLNNIVYSYDGITWSLGTASVISNWYSITYGNNKFVAVASDKTTYSSDGISWSTAIQPVVNSWHGVTYGNNIFVAVAGDSNADQVMYSSDGITWETATAAATDGWNSIAYGDGTFVATASQKGTNRVMYSSDGINWEAATAPELNSWNSVTYGDGKFVAVSGDGTYQIMYSETGAGKFASSLFYDENNAKPFNNIQLERRYGVDPLETDLRKFGIYPLTEQPTYAVDTYVKEGDYYNPVRDYTSEINAANAKVADLQSRLASLEADEVNDDATDTLLINTVANLLERVEELEGGG